MAVVLPEFAESAVPAVGVGPTLDDAWAGRFAALRRSADILVPACWLAFIAATCFLWPLIYPLRSPTQGSLLFSNLPPFSAHYLLGTDPLGVDIFSRILYGGRISLEVGLGATGLGLVIGGTVGIIAGYKGGLIETVIMRLLDMLLAFPSLVLAILVSTYLGPSELHVIYAIAFFSVPAFARLARASTLRLREQIFVLSADLSGGHTRSILLRHVAPNVVPQLMTFASLGVGVAIIVEASLSFLGLGVPPPSPSWGGMIALGEQYLSSDPYLILVPSAALFLTVMPLNLLSDALRSRLGAL